MLSIKSLSNHNEARLTRCRASRSLGHNLCLSSLTRLLNSSPILIVECVSKSFAFLKISDLCFQFKKLVSVYVMAFFHWDYYRVLVLSRLRLFTMVHISDMIHTISLTGANIYCIFTGVRTINHPTVEPVYKPH